MSNKIVENKQKISYKRAEEKYNINIWIHFKNKLGF